MSIMDNRTNLAAATLAMAGMAAVGVVGGVAGPANADLYKFTFGGEIFLVQGDVPEPWDTVHVGSEFEFWYIFDSEEPDHCGAPILGIYDTLGGELIIDGVPQATDEGDIWVWDNWVGSYWATLEGLPIGAGANIQLWETDILDSDELLLDIDLDDWGTAGLEVIGDGFVIGGYVTSFTGQIVPGPSATWLLAFTVLYGKHRRRCHNKQR